MDTVVTLLLTILDHPVAIHAGLFVILLFSGIGIGLLPEDVILVLGGYLAYLEFIRFPTALVVLSVGILAADTSGYLAGRFWGAWIEKNIVDRWRPIADMVEKVKRLFEKYGESVILITRPLFAIRVAVPIFAGHTRMDFKKFFLYDALVSIPWTMLIVSASYYLSATLDVFAEARQIKHYIFLGIVAIAVSYTTIRLMRSIRTRA